MIIIRATGAGGDVGDEREFPDGVLVSIAPELRASAFYKREDNVIVHVAAPSVDFLRFDYRPEQYSLYVSMASQEEVRDRLFIREEAQAMI